MTTAAAGSRQSTVSGLLGVRTVSLPAPHIDYELHGESANAADIDAAVALIADFAMEVRLGKSRLLTWWRDSATGVRTLTPSESAQLAPFVEIILGLPGAPGDVTHLQGHVAELLWGKLVAERLICPDGRTLVKVSPVKPDVNEPGGDGVVIYQDNNGILVFRLWEIKNHTGTDPVLGTISGASLQLRRRAPSYIAKLVAPGTLDPQLGTLYEDMMGLWLDKDPRTGVGVSVGTTRTHAAAANDPFQSIRKKFPDWSASGQREAIMIALPDFADFATKVREYVWKGL